MKKNCLSSKDVLGNTKSGETFTLARFVGTVWSLTYCHQSLQLQKKSDKDGSLFEVMGKRTVLFSFCHLVYHVISYMVHMKYLYCESQILDFSLL